MNDVVSMHVAKSTLSQLVKKAASGEPVYIGAYGRAQVKLVSVTASAPSRKQFGLLRGRLHLPDDLEAPLSEDVLASFEGGT